jgi:hypothetical protein
MTPLPHLQPHATVSWGCTPGPIDTEPMRLGFGFWRQTAPISRLPGSSPPGLFPCHSPAAHQPPTLLGGVITKVAPTSSPYGSIFGFGAKPPPSRAYRAPGPRTFCVASHPQPTNPQRCWVVLLRRSHRHRARAVRFSVSAPNHPHLALTGLQPPEPFALPLTRGPPTPNAVGWCWVVLLRRSHRHRARAARFSVSAPNRSRLARIGLQPSHCSKYMFFYYSQPHTVCLHPMYASCITMDPFVCSIYFLSYVYIYCII